MNTSAAKYKNVDTYISTFPKEIQKILKQVRVTVLASAPKAVEGISYGMPAYKVNGKPVAYFAAFKKHIGFYATPSGHAAFAKELAAYKQGKGSVQFLVSEPVPFGLIGKMVKYNVQKIK